MEENPVVKWLLEAEEPSINYRTLTELLDRPADDPDVIAARNVIPESQPVQQILKKMTPDHTWLQKKSSTGELIGDGVEYGSFATTHFVLANLAELGLDRTTPWIEKAAHRYLGLQQPDGNFWNDFSCLNGYNIRTFILLGFREDARVQKTLDLMLNLDRPDDGYLCNLHEGKYKTRATKSCIRGSGNMLLAYAETPGYWQHPRVLPLVDYFLDRALLYKTKDLTTPVHKDVTATMFPFSWSITALELLYAFGKMGYGADPRLRRAWQVLEDKKDADGRYILDRTQGQSYLKQEKGQPNKWITLYALLAHKHKEKDQ